MQVLALITLTFPYAASFRSQKKDMHTNRATTILKVKLQKAVKPLILILFLHLCFSSKRPKGIFRGKQFNVARSETVNDYTAVMVIL